MTITAGSGYSTAQDAVTAGMAATAAALERLRPVVPHVVLAFTTEHYDQAAVVQGIRQKSAATPLIGCCTGGLITNDGILAEGVAVLVLGGDELEVALAIAPDLSKTPIQSVELLTDSLEAHTSATDGKQRIALLFSDGLTASLTIDDALQATTNILGPCCPIFGGAAGDSLNYGYTTLFVNDNITNDALAVALLNTNARVGFGVQHGWRPAGQAVRITSSYVNTIYELDGKPAIEVYRTLLPNCEITPENFRSISRFHPIGFPHRNGEYLVRLPLEITPEGGIICIGALPSNTTAYIMEGDPDSLINAAVDAAKRAMAELGDRQPAAAIVIDCVTRPPLLGGDPLLGGRSQEEIEQIRTVIGDATPLIGMYSFGEFAAQAGPPSFHNKTVAICIIGQTA